MFNRFAYGLVFLLSLFLINQCAIADDSPTLDQVYQAAHSGRMDEALRMMDKVLKAHPDSAKAHFVEAELLAKQGQMGQADTELKIAERIKPDLSFAKPQAVQDLKSIIYSSHHVNQSPNSNSQPEQSSGFPWGLILLGVAAIAIITLIMRSLANRNAPTYPGNFQPGMQNGPVSPVPMQPYGGGMAQMGPVGGGMGSGIMGGLATGAAVGVGMVAGEALAHHFMDGGSSNTGNTAQPVSDSWSPTSNNMGGSDFGIADNSSWSDSTNIADSGSGGGGDWS
jgi:hypothetical protein